MDNVNKDILRLAIPSILANITIPLVGIVDTAIIGHISDAAAIGGIAIGTMLFDLLYWNFGFLRVGTSGLTAQAYGAGNHEECRKILSRSLTIAVLAAFLLWAIQWLFVHAVLAIVPCSPQVAAIAQDYFFVRIWAALATLMLFTFKGWFIGMQDTKSPMAVDIVVNVVNMGASYYLAVHTPLGIIGVAHGTVIAQYTGLLLAVAILVFKYRIVHIGWQEIVEAMRGGELKRMMALNGNLFIRSLCFMVVYVGYTWLASRYGDTELAVSSILMKLFMFFSFFVDGFAYAGEALVGKAYGELKMENGKWKINKIVHLLFNWGVGVGLLFTAIYAIWGDDCMALLTNDMPVLETADKYLVWLALMPIISSLAFTWDGVYIGATAGLQIRNSMIWAAVAFVALYLMTFSFVGTHALYIAYLAHLVARVSYLSANWKKINIQHI